MNNIELVKSVLNYIDENIRENLTFEKLADCFSYSPFHFHRIFSSVVGKSITEYIRTRRLGYAAEKLINTSENITQICYSCGFESIQTFCRVFKNTYDMTPKSYRNSTTDVKMTDIDVIQKYMNFIKEIKGDNIMIPKFINREDFKIIGVEGYTGNGFEIIQKSWKEFFYRINEIKNIKNGEVFYGYEDYSRDFVQESKHFYYIAGVEVSSLDEIPEGMTGKEIPASEYAVFTVKGSYANVDIGRAFRYIYDVWLPNSEYTYSSKICGDFEYYDRWNTESENNEADIYLPISKRK